jgi:hypothetical protein
MGHRGNLWARESKQGVSRIALKKMTCCGLERPAWKQDYGWLKLLATCSEGQN